jgi:hypothetical protein
MSPTKHGLMSRNINRTLDNGSSVFTYTPENVWGFLKDDGSVSGNTGVLDDYLNTGSKEVARSTLEKRQVKAGNTSVAVTDSSASVDMTFKGMSLSLGFADIRFRSLCLWYLWSSIWTSESEAG